MGFPGRDEELELHRRMVMGDPTASADIFISFIRPLVMNLCADLGCDPDEAHDSAIDALFSYFSDPKGFDPSIGRLSSYMQGAAWYKAVDRLRSRRRRDRFEENLAEDVELASLDTKVEIERISEVNDIWPRVRDILPSRSDRQTLVLILDGERSTEVLAASLSLPPMDTSEQKKEVKRHRDRLLKTLERLGKRLRDERAGLAGQSSQQEP